MASFDMIRVMLKIRLQRVGRKHEPVFRLVLTDSKNSTKSGKTLETLGNYDARHGDSAVVNAERVVYWMSQGAQTTPTVHNMLVEKKVITGKKINNLPLKKAIVKDAPKEEEKASTPVVETPAESVAEPVAETPVSEAPATVAESTDTTDEVVA
jgi:small subunit ribosomal protein S16